MNTAHTPGPWDYDSTDFDVYDMESGESLVVNEENARLIAAAPELLAALVALDNYISNNLSSDYPTGIDLSSLEFRNASEAIAKATGVSA